MTRLWGVLTSFENVNHKHKVKKTLVKEQEAIASLDKTKTPRKTKSPERETLAETLADTQIVNDTIQVPGLFCGVDLAVMKPIQASLAAIDEMEIEAVEKEIVKACGSVNKQSQVAVKAGTLVVAHAWQCGKFLNRAKVILKKGDFGKWRDEKLIQPGMMSDATSQRYMALAKNWDRLEDLLLSAPSLRAAYQECGILPHDVSKPEAAQNEQGGEVVVSEEVFLKNVDKIQEILRDHWATVSKISEQGRERLKSARVQINEIFANLLGEGDDPASEVKQVPPAKKASAKPVAEGRGK